MMRLVAAIELEKVSRDGECENFNAPAPQWLVKLFLGSLFFEFHLIWVSRFGLLSGNAACTLFPIFRFRIIMFFAS